MGRAKQLVKELGIASPEQAEEKMRALQTELDDYNRRYHAARSAYEKAEAEAGRAKCAFDSVRNEWHWLNIRERDKLYLKKWVTKRKLESDAVAALQMAFEHGCPHVRRSLRLANITVKFSAVAGKKRVPRHENGRQPLVIRMLYVYFEREQMTYTVSHGVTEDSPTEFRTHCDLSRALIDGKNETFENGCSYSQRHEDNLLRVMFPRAFRNLNNIHAWLDELVAMTCQPALREHLRRQSGRRRYFATHSVAQIEYGQYHYL